MLYLATKGGGAFFGKVGSFEPGYEFDAIVMDDSTCHHPAVQPARAAGADDLSGRRRSLCQVCAGPAAVLIFDVQTPRAAPEAKPRASGIFVMEGYVENSSFPARRSAASPKALRCLSEVSIN